MNFRGCLLLSKFGLAKLWKPLDFKIDTVGKWDLNLENKDD